MNGADFWKKSTNGRFIKKINLLHSHCNALAEPAYQLENIIWYDRALHQNYSQVQYLSTYLPSSLLKGTLANKTNMI